MVRFRASESRFVSLNRQMSEYYDIELIAVLLGSEIAIVLKKDWV